MGDGEDIYKLEHECDFSEINAKETQRLQELMKTCRNCKHLKYLHTETCTDYDIPSHEPFYQILCTCKKYMSTDNLEYIEQVYDSYKESNDNKQ